MAWRPVVVKVGGSLFDLPDLGPRLRAWLATCPGPVVLVPGGGPTADVIRDLDRRHGLGEEAAHWLALRALTLNAHFLLTLLPAGHGALAAGTAECEAVWSRSRLAVVDAHAFAMADEGRPGCLPHVWSVTSDSLAARLAVVLGAAELVLLKSVTVLPRPDWTAASARGFVDPYFPQAAAPLAVIRAVNFREWRPGAGGPPAGERPTR